MELFRLCVAGLLLQAAAVLSMDSVSSGRPGYGFIGYGISMYHPPCAFGCKDSISPLLNCSTEGDDMGGMMMKRMSGMGDSGSNENLPSGDGWMVMAATAECKADDDYFLQTFAYCVNSRCPDVPIATLETFWARDALGRKTEQPSPKISYQVALQAAMASSPTRELNNSIILNYTAVVTDNQYIPNFNADSNFENAEVTHERYGLVLFLTGTIVPIGLSLLRFLPWPTWFVSRVNALLIDPPLVGSKHSTPIWDMGIMPTRGQALFIAYLWLINIVLSAVGYDTIWPHSWYQDKESEIAFYVANRVGILSFANLPLVVLYSGRNNVLLWLTNWSHSTFVLIHRWLAFICMLQACLHSVIYLQIYLTTEGEDYASESQLPYWYWGIIGTLSLVVLVVVSVHPVRQRVYEAFLASHIALAILALVGCLLHIFFRYQRQWGYETWIYMAAAIWAFDRLARLARTLGAGARRAYITVIDDDYYRVDIHGVSCTGHVYLHFPTLSTWRFWENHPFSVAGVTGGPVVVRDEDQEREQAVLSKPMHTGEKESVVYGGSNASPSDLDVPVTAARERKTEIGTTFFVRKHEGITALLHRQGSSFPAGIPVLVEASYGPGMTFLQDEEVVPTCEFPNILCIAGGVGVTAVLPILNRTNHLMHPIGATKLYWGVRTQPLVHAVEEMLGVGRNKGDVMKDVEEKLWGNVQVTVSVGQRLDLRTVIETELKSQRGGTTVVVCGPPEMADEVRCIVSGISRHATEKEPVARLAVECFSW
ncbi:ferric-chelate reductase fre2 [Trichoderma arundinaceum]|uniref:Ferric-chelate reductase fre2 n=1 Tax=Trichoderma arundinaceum TaxID=490622 RepID=A0A395NGR4_TRIAR|nr:ferric-chelate reductase fre2 [Trichoderma arundinaceum]